MTDFRTFTSEKQKFRTSTRRVKTASSSRSSQNSGFSLRNAEGPPGCLSPAARRGGAGPQLGARSPPAAPLAMPSQRGSARRRQRCVLLAGIAILLIALVLAAVLASALTGRKEEASPEPLRWQGRGTTRNLREIVLGRCYSYLAEGRVKLG